MPHAKLTEDHRYIIPSGEEVPATTRILASCGASPDYSHTDIFYRNFGTEMHALTRDFDEGWLSEEDIALLDDMKRIPLEGYRRVLKMMPEREWLLVETPLYHPRFWYGGTPDRVGVERGSGRVFLWDLKFGSPDPSHSLQLAAYKELVEAHFRGEGQPEFAISSCSTLYIAADGSPKLVTTRPSEERKNLATFLGMLGAHCWKIQNGRG